MEGGGVQAGNEKAEGAAVREVGASVRVSILHYCNAILFKSVLNRVLNNVMCDRLESELELELICYCNAMLFKLSHF